MTADDRARPHVFEVPGWWSGRKGLGQIRLGGGQDVAISTPAQFGGRIDGTNPEELLLGAALACYLMTLARVCEKAGLEPDRIRTSAIGEVGRTGDGLRFERIRLRPVVRAAGLDPGQRDRLLEALRQAERLCFIARTLRPAVPYTIEPVFEEGGSVSSS